MSRIIRIGSEFLPLGASSVYNADFKHEYYFIGVNGKDITSIKNMHRVIYPNFEITDDDNDILNLKILMLIVKLASIAYSLHVTDNLQMIKLDITECTNNKMKLAMFHVFYNDNHYDYKYLPEKIDLDDFGPDASMKDLKNLLTVMHVLVD